ncbi:unnamed protein product [Somion occarium]|uniref:Uncharacterized protein n=1 Tax=Somion occarium TaxID=3059160 RepID=A0ABP1CXJ2_9APHY
MPNALPKSLNLRTPKPSEKEQLATGVAKLSHRLSKLTSAHHHQTTDGSLRALYTPRATFLCTEENLDEKDDPEPGCLFIQSDVTKAVDVANVKRQTSGSCFKIRLSCSPKDPCIVVFDLLFTPSDSDRFTSATLRAMFATEFGKIIDIPSVDPQGDTAYHDTPPGAVTSASSTHSRDDVIIQGNAIGSWAKFEIKEDDSKAKKHGLGQQHSLSVILSPSLAGKKIYIEFHARARLQKKGQHVRSSEELLVGSEKEPRKRALLLPVATQEDYAPDQEDGHNRDDTGAEKGKRLAVSSSSGGKGKG